MIGIMIDGQAFPPTPKELAERYVSDPAELYDDSEYLQSCHGSFFVGYLFPPSSSLGIVLYSYGNQCDSRDPSLVNDLREFCDRTNFTVVVYDYPGYGPTTTTTSEKIEVKHTFCSRILRFFSSSKRECSEGAMYDNSEVVFDHLTSKYAEFPLFLWGYSIGSAATCHLAHREFLRLHHSPIEDGRGRKYVGIILQSALASALTSLFGSAAQTNRFLRYLDRFNNVLLAEKDHGDWGPVFMIHGKSDRIVEFNTNANALYTKMNVEDHLWVEEKSHTDIVLEDYVKKLKPWMELRVRCSLPPCVV